MNARKKLTGGIQISTRPHNKPVHSCRNKGVTRFEILLQERIHLKGVTESMRPVLWL